MADIIATASASVGLTTDKADGSFNSDQDALDAASWVPFAGNTVTPDVDFNPVTGELTADRLVDANGGASTAIQQTIVIAPVSFNYKFSFLVRKTFSAPATFPAVGVLFLGGAAVFTRYVVNPQTGALLLASGHTPALSTNVIDRNSYWEVQFTQASGNNTSLITEATPTWSTTFSAVAELTALGNHDFGSIKVINSQEIAGVFAQKIMAQANAQNVIGMQLPKKRGQKLPGAVADLGEDGVKERVESRNLRQGSDGRVLTRLFIIRGIDNPILAIDIGPQVGDPDDLDPNFLVANRELTVVAVEGADESGSEDGGDQNGVLDLVVEFTERRNDFSGISRQSALNVTGETRHTELAIEQDSEPQAAADRFGVSIGPEGKDKELKGADVEEPVIEVVETHIVATFSVGYRTTLLGLLQKINSDSFRGFKPGEVRFRGFSTRKLASGQTEIQFTFAVNRNREFQVEITDDKGGVNIANIDQNGWQWFWAEFGSKDGKGANKGKKIRITRSVHLADIYEESSFAGLDIGLDPIT